MDDWHPLDLFTPLTFSFEAGGVVVSSSDVPRGWLSNKQRLWTFRADGLDRTRRCGLDRAVETALLFGERCDDPSFCRVPEEELGSEQERVYEAWAPHEVKCRRLAGDPSVPILPPLADGAELGVLYLVQCRDKVKIGFTRGRVVDRIRSLQTGSSERLRYVLAIRGTAQEEKILHRAFAGLRCKGEWFWRRACIVSAFALIHEQPGRAVSR